MDVYADIVIIIPGLLLAARWKHGPEPIDRPNRTISFSFKCLKFAKTKSYTHSASSDIYFADASIFLAFFFSFKKYGYSFTIGSSFSPIFIFL